MIQFEFSLICSKEEIEKIEILQMSDTEPDPPTIPETNGRSSQRTPQPTNSTPNINANFNKPKTPSNFQKDQKRNRRRHKNSHGRWEELNSEGEFDFEKNLALFDKEAIFKEIEACNGNQQPKPDLLRQCKKPEDKYRHDQNVLQSVNYRQIQLEFESKNSYFTDVPGIVIPSIPQSLRNRIQNLADSHGLSWSRQNDMLAKGVTDLAIQLLGGSRRLCPKNFHQFPKIVVICDEPYNDKKSEVGIATARMLASHGLKVMVYVKTATKNDNVSKELELFTATGNDFTFCINDLFPKSDLIILAVKSMTLYGFLLYYFDGIY
jgi:enhancer of mRNA-decapping protein 3